MPIRDVLLACACALCAVSRAPFSVQAAVPPPPDSPVNVRFDAPAGRYQQAIRQAPCAATSLHTNIQIDKAYRDQAQVWAPVVQIVINEMEIGPLHTGPDAALVLVPGDRKSAIELRRYSQGRVVDQIPFSLDAPFGKNIDTTVSWTADGSLSVTQNRERHSIALGEPVKTIKFTVSGAKAEFADVQFDAPASSRECSGKRGDI